MTITMMLPQEKEMRYGQIQQELQGLLSSALPWESALTSLLALLKERFPIISWVGFYRAHGQTLWVGPYQGKLACLSLKPGQGVCGAAFAKKETLIVPDVHQFPGHVACDASARSEIVVPVYQALQLGRECIGVLDLDSHELAAFDATDQKHLEDLLKMIEHLPNAMT